jgi:hypothetical protein
MAICQQVRPEIVAFKSKLYSSATIGNTVPTARWWKTAGETPALVRWRVCEVKEMKVLLEPMFRLVVEGNRVAARQGGKQPETNHQTAGYELDSA